MRILHIVDLTDHASAPALACASAVSRAPGAHAVWTIGHPALPSAWLAPSRRFAAPTGSPLLAWRALRRALDQERDSFDLVTCWSIGALTAFHAASRAARSRFAVGPPRVRPGIFARLGPACRLPPPVRPPRCSSPRPPPDP